MILILTCSTIIDVIEFLKRKRLLKILGVIGLAVLLWQFDYFNRFNYLTAKIDIWRDSPCIAHYGLMSYPCGVPCIALEEKYGFRRSGIGCFVSKPDIRGIEAYNKQIEKYLNKRNGEDWRQRYEAELDSLIQNDHLE